MRLTKMRRPVRTPAERERRRLSVGKAVYFLILAALVVAVGRFGVRKVWYIDGRGFVRGEAALVQTVDRGRVVFSSARVGEPVTEGAVLARLVGPGRGGAETGDPDRGRQRLLAELRRLEARARDEAREARDEAEREAAALTERIARLRRQLAGLRAEEDRARIERRARETETDRWKRLYELEALSLAEYLRRVPAVVDAGAGAEAEIAAIETEIAQLEARVARVGERQRRPPASAETRARLAAVRQALKSYRPPPVPGPSTAELRAPLSGVVTEVFRREGEVLLAGEPLARIVDPGSVYVEAWFPPPVAGRLRDGTRVDLVIETGLRAAGRVERVDPAVTPLPGAYQKKYEPPVRALRVRIRPEDPDLCARVLDAKVRVRLPRFGGS